ncbi:peptide chain release factor N(5)-glutamine methyltransferase [Patescibacteria group bacterium]|nr:MAG: peptide chain release factor N(5)-glutamine methyltransferase [Patescibacteria group bacterium]
MQKSTTPASWLASATAQLSNASIPSARLDAEIILAHTRDVTRTWLHAHHDEVVDTTLADELILKRLRRVPIAYLTGSKEFFGRTFTVTTDTLIPRPETEMLIDIAKQYKLSGNVIDVGTGSGCVGITLALETDATVTLCDISPSVLQVAQHNARQLGADSVICVKSNLLEAFVKEGVASTNFDAIIANLPYVNPIWDRSPETDYEPSLALFADDNGLALIKTLIDQSKVFLTPNGYLLLEADPEQHRAIRDHAQPEFRHCETQGYALLLQRI